MARVAMIFSIIISLFLLSHARHSGQYPRQEDTAITLWSLEEENDPKTDIHTLELSADAAATETAAPNVTAGATAPPNEVRLHRPIERPFHGNQFVPTAFDGERNLYPAEDRVGDKIEGEGMGHEVVMDDHAQGVRVKGWDRDAEATREDKKRRKKEKRMRWLTNAKHKHNEEEEDEDDEDDDKKEKRLKREDCGIKKHSGNPVLRKHMEEKVKRKNKESGMKRLMKLMKRKHEKEEYDDDNEDRDNDRKEIEEGMMMKRLKKLAHEAKKKRKEREESRLNKRLWKLVHKKYKEQEEEEEKGGFMKRLRSFMKRFF